MTAAAGVILHMPFRDPDKNPAARVAIVFLRWRCHRITWSGLGMHCALVLHGYPVLWIGQIWLTHDAGSQDCGHVQFRFRQPRHGPARSRSLVSGAESAPIRACSKASRALRIPGVPLCRSSISASSPGRSIRLRHRPSRSGRGWRNKWSATTVSSSMLIFREQSSQVLAPVVTSTPSTRGAISSAKNWPHVADHTPAPRDGHRVRAGDMDPRIIRAREEARKVPDQEGRRVGGRGELRDQGEGPGLEPHFCGAVPTGSRIPRLGMCRDRCLRRRRADPGLGCLAHCKRRPNRAALGADRGSFIDPWSQIRGLASEVYPQAVAHAPK